MIHIPVLLKEVVEILDPKPGEFVIDGTVNGGGHARVLAQKIGAKGTLLGIDWDPKAIARIKESRERFHTRTIFEEGNYAEIPKLLKQLNLGKADALLLDLGLSSEQLAPTGRGFSFSTSEILDMRYNTNEKITAAQVVNGMPEKELADIIYRFGEERLSRRIAKAIVKERKHKRILTTGELARIVGGATSKNYEKGRIHPATRTFQALRIYVNRELENLSSILAYLDQCIKKGGKVVVISFHSLEDRIVKQKFQELAKEGRGTLITKKLLLPGREEISANPRSRSAKLRAIKLV